MKKAIGAGVAIAWLLALFAALTSVSSPAGEAAHSYWTGTYNGLGRACTGDLTIEKSSFSWMDCTGALTRRLVDSEKQYAFLVDPASSCSWAGHVISLINLSPKAPLTVRVYAYEDRATFMSDRERKRYLLSCPYAKHR